MVSLGHSLEEMLICCTQFDIVITSYGGVLMHFGLIEHKVSQFVGRRITANLLGIHLKNILIYILMLVALCGFRFSP